MPSKIPPEASGWRTPSTTPCLSDDWDLALRAKGSRLIRRQGDSLEVLRGLIRETGARALAAYHSLRDRPR